MRAVDEIGYEAVAANLLSVYRWVDSIPRA